MSCYYPFDWYVIDRDGVSYQEVKTTFFHIHLHQLTFYILQLLVQPFLSRNSTKYFSITHQDNV